MKRSCHALVALTVLLGLTATQATAASRMESVKSFTEMQERVDRFKDPAATLVVMDDDDTLTMMSCPDPKVPETCQYLGGPAWFTWQMEQVQNMDQPRVADTFDELLTISSMLFATNNMPFTASDVGPVLNELAGKGVRLLVETARGEGDTNATLRQFGAVGINLERKPDEPAAPTPVAKTLAALIAKHSLNFGDLASLAGPYQPCANDPDAQTKYKLGRDISYQQGAMFVSGQHKGAILKCMLDKYNQQAGAQPVKYVVFIDDTEQNVLDVHEAFKKADEYQVKALHYTHLDEHKKALTEGEMAPVYQRNAMERWYRLRDALSGALMNPVGP